MAQFVRDDGVQVRWRQVICDASRHAVLHLDAEGKELTPASTISDGQPIRGPNDLTLDPSSGGVYFTDPASSDDKKPDGTVHYIDSRGVTHTVARGLAFPNGIVIRPGFSIHTAFMQFPIDAVFLDSDLVVLRIEQTMRPFRAASCRTSSTSMAGRHTDSRPVGP